jgi:hypothetical protein
MPHAPLILATIVLELVLAASGGLLTRMLCLRSLVKDLAVGSAIGPSTLGFILWRRSYRARQTAVDRCRRRPLASSIGALANQADVEGPGFRLAMLTRDRPSRTGSIGRDRSLERLSADSLETVSRFEFPVGTGDRIERLRRKLQTIEELKNDLRRYAEYPSGCPA